MGWERERESERGMQSEFTQAGCYPSLLSFIQQHESLDLQTPHSLDEVFFLLSHLFCSLTLSLSLSLSVMSTLWPIVTCHFPNLKIKVFVQSTLQEANFSFYYFLYFFIFAWFPSFLHVYTDIFSASVGMQHLIQV